jgi:hypothetical protein
MAGMWMPVTPGLGKTNLLNGLIHADLERVANGECSILIMDSKEHPTESLLLPWRNVLFNQRINALAQSAVW